MDAMRLPQEPAWARTDGDAYLPRAAELPDGRLGAMLLQPVPESVSRARRWFRKFIAPYNPACSLDDCELMISEVVTNAILYGEAEEAWQVRVEWRRVGTCLRVEVHSPGPPARVRMRSATTEDAHGRGLHLVEALAHSWSVANSPFGTVVSFVVADAWPCGA